MGLSTTSVTSKNLSTTSIFTNKRLIHRHRYDSAHLCVCVKVKQRDPQWMDSVMVSWCHDLICLVTPVVLVAPYRWSRFHPGSHQALFAQLLGLLWWSGQRLLWDDLSTRLGHPDSSLHSSAAKDTSGHACSQPWRRACDTCRASHLYGTRHVDTLSSCRSLCWSRRHEGGCRQCETFWLCLLLLLSFKLRFRPKA